MMKNFGKTNGAKMAALMLAMAVLGCKGTTTSAAANDGSGVTDSSGSLMSAITSATVSTKISYITDPTLGDMNADSVKLPSRWAFRGWLSQGDTCATVPYAVYKAVSPDGLTTVEEEPEMVWKYGSGPAFEQTNRKDCLPLNGPISAQDFIKHYAETLNLTYVGPEPVPAAVLAAEQKKRDENNAKAASMGMPANFFKTTDDRGRGIVTSKTGPVTFKGHFDVTMHCVEVDTPARPTFVGVPMHQVMGQPSVVNNCSARVTYLNTTEAKYAEVSRAFDSGQWGIPVVESAWGDAWMKRSNAQFRQNMQAIGDMMRQAMAAHAQQFAQQMAVQQANHDNFMQSFNSNFQRSQQVNNANMQARQTAASDEIDFAGNKQTALDPVSGVSFKVPNDVTIGQPYIRAHGDGSPW